MEKPLFSYDSLGLDTTRREIRLIRLSPTSCDVRSDASFTCTMNKFPLDECPEYNPFSYVWGAGKKVSIECNGARLEVLPNLYDALAQYCSEVMTETYPSESWVWIDAICINQNDEDEKSWQIQLMREIYSRGALTWIWLGTADKWSDEAIALLFTLHRVKWIQELRVDTRYFFQMSVEEREQLGLPMPMISSDYNSLTHLLSRPWFNRVWVIQELALSRNSVVQCGNSSMPWWQFFEAVEFGQKFRVPISTSSLAWRDVFEMDLFREMHQDEEHISLPVLLMLARNRQATEAKDKIYALCGLADDIGPNALGIVPNYSKDLTAEEEYCRVAKRILARDHALDLLSVPKPRVSSYTLPSWVPDWSTSSAGNGLVCPGAAENAVHYGWATPKGLRSIDFDEDRSLRLSGHVVDRIEAIAQTWKDEKTLDSSWIALGLKSIPREQAILNEWEDVCQLNLAGQYKYTGETRLDAYWQTLMAGRINGKFDTAKENYIMYDKFVRTTFRGIPSLLLWWFGAIAFIPAFMRVRKVVKTSPDGLNSIAPIMAFRAAMIAATDRRMFRTPDGLIGLAPASAQVGDEIALFKGGKVPLVVRRVPNLKKWLLIGDCYVHGIMGGQAFILDDCVEFSIC